MVSAALLTACAFTLASYQGSTRGSTLHFGASQRGDWDQTVKQYSRLVEQDKSNAEYWYRLAYAQEMSGKLEESIQSYTESAQLRHKVVDCYLGMARAYTSLSRRPEALRSIRMATVSGLTDPNVLLQEPLFTDYRDDEHFKKSIDYVVNPVHQYPSGDALAFWIGEWIFQMTDGTTGGHSLVKREKRGFTIVEQWTSADGSTAKSIYTYDKENKQWLHTWISSSGNISRRTVKSIKDGVEMTGVSTYPDGTQLHEKEILRRMPDGKIEQTISQSFDNGDTWIQVSKGTFTSVNKEGIKINLKGDGRSEPMTAFA